MPEMRGTVRQIELGFARKKRKHTKAFEKEVIPRLADAPMDHLKKKYSDINLSGFKYIAIDETSVGRNYRYVTMVLDLESAFFFGWPLKIG
ncbi:MAG: hypothetical protein LBR53_09985 [Deltaproteobacteria bacterium]|jgi:transposase|nr:hypothetical protein [Deltaproteobacteria bacterium]